MKALLLAAGKSTRIHPVSKGRPKPLLDVEGDPIIFRNLRWLAAEGVKEVFINLHYRPDEIRDAVGDGSKFGLDITYVVEHEILGTAGAVKNLEKELGGSTFVVVYGDNLLSTDLSAFETFHRDRGGAVSIAVFDRNTHAHTGIAGGRVVTGENDRIERFAEGAGDDVSSLVNAGVYFVEPSVLELIPPATFYDFGKQVFPHMLEKGLALYGHSISGYCLGIDTPESWERALELIRAGEVSLHSMIITRTPFRVTLGGGGTDLPSFYEREGGFIFAMGLNKYMYLCVNRPIADTKVRLHYTKAEEVEHVSQLKHELAREALRRYGIERQIEISSLADIPAGTGVGSSSCYLVGLLTALQAHKRDYQKLEKTAEDACHIELDILKKPIGKQDQYMAAFGGFTVLEIAKDGKVDVRQVDLGESAMADLVGRTHIYYTGTRRAAPDVLTEQDDAMKKTQHPKSSVVGDSLKSIKDLGYRILDQIERQEFDEFGLLLHEHWERKKRMSKKISSARWDEIYDEARANYNVLGGKIIGAGGGGFLMLYCAKAPRRLETFMKELGMPRVHYGVDREGTKVVASLPTS